eukprot:TRINITY_DN5902_c0_g1_i2.p1 TRINITY_DN5902_c0_g1~~TRINITY_DN5902_c0_g1_i2.p1  ORF type:complete len:1002 (+),score=256.65 TRINITY_DN5902_c0_g1_i2:40-3006(+)
MSVTFTEVPVKSPNDRREYRSITLDNGIKAILISDSETTKAAACLCVNVGSFADPPHIAGLAHFLEHMLFLGTSKYPHENEYSAYIQNHGGNKNASTSQETTDYYFDIDHAFLHGALDRFAQFFLGPLFTETATDREMHAVDSEHCRNIQIDARRQGAVFTQICRKDHPASKFSTGNLQTLSVPDLREQLLKFHSTYYSASIMTLSILGRENLDQLQNWVLEFFSGIPSNGCVSPPVSSQLFEPQALPLEVRIVPVRHFRNMRLMWPLRSSYWDKWRQKPTRYVSHLLGHEGSGSLLSLLKRRGWANSLETGSFRETKGYCVLNCFITLTETGFEARNEVVSLVFSYLDMLRRTLGPDKQWVYAEEAQIALNAFNFKQQEEPMDLVQHLAEELIYYPPKDILSTSLFWDFDTDLIREILDQLVPSNLLLYVVAKDFEGQTDRTEKYSSVPFASSKVPEATQQAWEHAPESQDLYMPRPNPFIPTQFGLKAPIMGLEVLDRREYPRLIMHTPLTNFWYKEDNIYGQPRARVYIRFVTPHVYSSPRNFVLSDIGVNLIEDRLDEVFYGARLAGLEVGFQLVVSGIEMKVSGYNDKIAIFLKDIAAFVSQFQVDSVRFPVIQEKVQRDYKNARLDQPISIATLDSITCMRMNRWTNDEKLAVFENPVSASEVERMVHTIFREDVKLDILAMGNITEQEALDMVSSVVKIAPTPDASVVLGSRPMPSSCYPYNRMVDLPPLPRTSLQSLIPPPADASEMVPETGIYSRRLANLNPDDLNSASVITFMCGMEYPRANALLTLAVELLLEPAFYQLRTVEQLGYVVQRYASCTDNVISMKIAVQSGTKDPVHLESRIWAFLHAFRKDLGAISDEDFNSSVQSLVVKKEEKPHTLGKLVHRFWTHITEHRADFDRIFQEIKELKTLTKAEVIEFYDKIILSDHRKVLSVLVFGKAHRALVDAPAPAGTHLITDHVAFKRSMPLYPVYTDNIASRL